MNGGSCSHSLGVTALDRDLSCLTAAIQMLKSIKPVHQMFQHQTYKTGVQSQNTQISDEISRCVTGKSKTVSQLRVMLKKYSGDAAMHSAKFPSLELVFFRVLHERVRMEFQSCNETSKELWAKFTGSSYNFLEQYGKLTVRKTLEKEIKKENTIQEFLVIRTYHSLTGYIFPENKIHLSNGDTYILRCIVDHDPSTGRYRSSVVINKTWMMIDERSRQPASKEEVKTRLNYLYLYSRVYGVCPVKGCPDQRKFDFKMDLDLHHEEEHPTCRDCGEEFLLGCLYREHLYSWVHDKMKTDLSCLSASVNMLLSIKHVSQMFLHQTYKTGDQNQITEICDEISRYAGESNSVSHLQVMLKKYSGDAAVCSAKFPSLEIVFFKVLLDLVGKELQSSSPLWTKFTEGIYFLERRGELTVKEVIMMEINKNEKVPEYLVIKTDQPPTGYIFPENKVLLSNGDTYQLHCIVDHDQSTGRYRSSVVINKTGMMIDENSRQPASKEEVKTRRNRLYLYGRVYHSVCTVEECPDQRNFDDKKRNVSADSGTGSLLEL